MWARIENNPEFAAASAKAKSAKRSYVAILQGKLIPQITKIAKELLESGASCCDVGVDAKGIELVLVADQTVVNLKKLMQKVPLNVPE